MNGFITSWRGRDNVSFSFRKWSSQPLPTDEQAAGGVGEVVVVHGAELVVLELGQQDRVHRRGRRSRPR